MISSCKLSQFHNNSAFVKTNSTSKFFADTKLLIGFSFHYFLA